MIPVQLLAQPGLKALLEKAGGSVPQAADIRSVQVVGYVDGRSCDGNGGRGQGYLVVALAVDTVNHGTWLSDGMYIPRHPSGTVE